MTQKHTQGPWFAHWNGHYFDVTEHSGRFALSKLNAAVFAHDGKEAQQANANLIAAAPDLLEALKGARTGLDLLSEFSAYKKTAIAKIKEIDAAIAKAEGRS